MNDYSNTLQKENFQSKMLLLMRHHWSCIFVISILLVLISPVASAQELEIYKGGVVRIKNTKLGGGGAGIIIKIDNDRAYVITASHVIRGDPHPDVFFYRQSDPYKSEIIDIELDDLSGLALIVVKANKKILKERMPLNLGSSSVKGGEAVNVIGFPDGTTSWSVTLASISRLDGRKLVFAGPIREGNSGGPVLFNGRVIGLVTYTIEASAYAVRVENISNYIQGLSQIPNLLDEPAIGPGMKASTPENIKFCQALSQIISASHDDFSAIVNLKSSNSIGDLFDSSITLPGTSRGLIHLESKFASFMVDLKNSSPLGNEYYRFISMIKTCLPNWKQTDSSKDKLNQPSDYAIIQPTPESRYHRFSESVKGVVVQVDQNKYSTSISIYAPDSIFKPGSLSIYQDPARSAIDFLSEEDRTDEVCQAILKLVDAGQSDNFYSIVKSTSIKGLFESTLEIPGLPVGSVKPRDKVTFNISSDNINEIESLYFKLVAIVRTCLKEPDWRRNETQADPSKLYEYTRYNFFEINTGAIVEISHSNPKRAYHNLTLTIYSPNSPTRPK